MNRNLTAALIGLVICAGSTIGAPRLIAVTASRVLHEINPVTGESVQIGTVSANAGTTGGLAYNCATGTLWLTSTGNDTLLSLDLSTGNATLIGAYGGDVVMHGLEYDNSTNTLYGGSDGELYTIDQTTGAATFVGASGTTSFFNLGYHRRRDEMFASSGTTDSFYSVNRSTGAVTLIGPMGSPTNPHSFAYNKDNGALYMIDTGTNALYIMDVLTGAAHKIGDAPTGNVLGLAYVSDDCAESLVPNAAGFSSPTSILGGQSTTITAYVQPVDNRPPPFSIASVTADLTAFGGGAAVPMTAGPDNTFTLVVNVPVGQAGAMYAIPLTITDVQGRIGSGGIGLRVRPGAPAGFIVETEPNDTKFAANVGEINVGQGVYGATIGTSTVNPGDASADNFKLKMSAASPGIYRNRMVITTAGTAGHTGTIRGLTQTLGLINAGTDSGLQTSSTSTTPPRYNQWYSFGKREEFYYRVTGGSSTTAEYVCTHERQPVTPIDLGTNLNPGPIVIARTVGVTTAVDFLVYDSDFNPVADFVSEGTLGLVRTYAAGTYYLGISNTNTCDDRATPGDSSARSSSVCDFPGMVLNTSTTLVGTLSMTFDDGAHTVDLPTPKTEAFEVVWVKFVVGAAGNGGCQPADIADDQGNPLPSANSNTGVNEGDYNAFFAGFFEALAYCDQWDDAGNPLPSAGVNTGVNEGDYNGFFATFFAGCP